VKLVNKENRSAVDSHSCYHTVRQAYAVNHVSLTAVVSVEEAATVTPENLLVNVKWFHAGLILSFPDTRENRLACQWACLVTGDAVLEHGHSFLVTQCVCM